MMIPNLQINRFKGFEKNKFSDFSRFNIFVGKNDSGKSSILEAIYAIKASLITKPFSLNRILRPHAGRQQIGKGLWFDDRTEENVVIKTSLNDKEIILIFSSDYGATGISVSISVGDKTKSFTTDQYMNTIQKGNTNENLIDSLEGEIKITLQQITFFDNLFSYRMNEWETVENLPDVTNDEYDESTELVKRASYMQNDKRLQLRINGRNKFIDVLGEGHKTGFALLASLDKLKNTIILIDEIENHQHPSSLRILIEKLINKCKSNNLQVFITTHSPEVLQLFSKESETKIYHLQKGKDSVRTTQISFNDMMMIRDLGLNVGNILEFETIIVVEGVLDEIIFRKTMYKLKGFFPEEIGVNIITAGSKTKQKEILKIISDEGKRIFVQRDKDDLDHKQIIDSIRDSYTSELQREGYELKQNNSEMTLINSELNRVKFFNTENILITGMPEEFPNIERHASDDYLLKILKDEPSLLTKLSTSSLELNEFKGKNSKEILDRIFDSYDYSIADSILSQCNKDNIPKSLSKLIEKIIS